MDALIYLDTHAAVWLYANQLDRFPISALHTLEESDLLVCPVVLLELQLLKEIKRFAATIRSPAGNNHFNVYKGRVSHVRKNHEV